KCVEAICVLVGWDLGHAYVLRDNKRELVSTGIWCSRADLAEFKSFCERSGSYSFKPGIGLPGRVLQTGIPIWVDDVRTERNFPRAAEATECGLCSAIASPILIGTEVVGVFEFFVRTSLTVDEGLVDLLGQIGTQIGRALERDRAEKQLRQ